MLRRFFVQPKASSFSVTFLEKVVRKSPALFFGRYFFYVRSQPRAWAHVLLDFNHTSYALRATINFEIISALGPLELRPSTEKLRAKK